MIHHVYANQSNAGDWLSALGIQALVAPLSVCEHFCDEPFVERTLAALNAAGPNDFIIIGGGGLFMDYFVPFWEGFRAIARQVPFCIWGVGYCDMKRERTCPPQKLIGEIVRRSRLCIVRDELTRRRLSDCFLPSPIPCPTINAVVPRCGEQKRLLHVDHFDNVGEALYQCMVAVGETFAERTGRSYRQANNLIPTGRKASLQAILDLYASADLVLTSRLHACLIALAMGRRVLVVSGDHKIESFMEAAGLREWVCDLDEIEFLPDRLQMLPQQRLPTAYIEQARRRNQEVAHRVRGLVEEIQSAGVST